MPTEPLSPEKARDIAVAKAGGPAALAKALGISSQAVTQWKVIPIERCMAVERVTGISHFALRPDHFGRPYAPPMPRRQQNSGRDRQDLKFAG